MLKYCPNCKSKEITFTDNKRYYCESCDWTYYQNAAAAVGAFLILKGKILFTIRAKEPAKDKLDLPGGFIDPGETAEQAIKREVKEELGLNISNFKYLGSAANEYPYKNTTYHTCDLIFLAKIDKKPPLLKKSEIKGYILKNADEINSKEIAFKSVKKAIKSFIPKYLKI